ncbi:helix-turn-helix domain-containing protein [Candidatus Dojkabacteria bacterium]|nr:helix-turn-helix domain-containing protein [Candidatus Dojkabacteria bacterium]
MYKYFFPGGRWDKFLQNTCQRLNYETVLITGLPHSGLTTFLKYVEDVYPSITKKEKVVIISLDIIQKGIKPGQLAKSIASKLRFKLNSPIYLESLSSEELFSEIIKRGKEIIVILNRFQNLRLNPQNFDFLNSLRSINSLKVRFLISCDISCLTHPQSYKRAGTLASANQIILPSLNEKEIELSIKNYKKLFNWNVPLKFTREIFSLSGGNIGIAKYLIKYIHEYKKLNNVDKLLKFQVLEYKVKDIYDKLQTYKLIKNGQLNYSRNEFLKKLYIIDKNNQFKIKILEPLVTKTEKSRPNLKKIFTMQEYRLYKLFTSNPDRIVTLDDISRELWGKEEEKKYSLWSIYKTLSNLRRKVKEIGLEIKNYRGRGYSLN